MESSLSLNELMPVDPVRPVAAYIGGVTGQTSAFLSEGAALIRARLLLADAITVSPRRSFCKVA